MKGSHIALAGLVALAYAGCFVAISVGLQYAPPLQFAGWRALVAGITLLLVARLSGRPVLPPRRLRAWVPVLAAVLAVQYAAMFLSPGRAGAGLSSVLANTAPILLVLIGAFLLQERITRLTALALLLGTLGVTMIAWPAMSGGVLLGILVVVLPLTSAFSSATETALFKRIDAADALLPVAAWQLVLASLALLLAGAWFEPGPGIVWSRTFVAILTFLALPGTAVGLAVWYWLVQREPVGRLAGFMFLVPLAGLLLAWAAFGETLSGLQIAGVVVTLAGILVALDPFPMRRGRAATRPA